MRAERHLCWKNLKGREHLENLELDGRKIFIILIILLIMISNIIRIIKIHSTSSHSNYNYSEKCGMDLFCLG